MKILDNIFVQIVIFLGLAMLFLNTVSPFETTKIASQWNLNLLGVLGAVVLFTFTEKKEVFDDFFRLKDYREFFSRFASGLLWGIVTIVFLALTVKSFAYLTNIFGSIPATTLASLSKEGAIFVVLVQPLTETILLVAGVLFLFSVLRNNIPFAMPIAIVSIALLFAAFHFAVEGKNYYEYSFSGFLNFIGDVKGYGREDYHGGFPFVMLGIFWISLAIIYKSFVEPFAAHLTYNFLVLFFNSNTPEVVEFLSLIGLLLLIVFGFVAYFTRLEMFNKYKVERLLGDLR
ncbi:MAG: hypothetical protein ACTSV7_14870 [Candidatus Baldrarchaeia archaeon]